MSEWHYQSGGKQLGPISAGDLKALVEAGRLLPTDHVRKEGTNEWRPAREVKGLVPASPAATTPAAEGAAASGSGGVLGLFSLLTGLAAILVGAAAIAAFWTPLAGWTVLLAMIALIAGTLTLLVDWIRDVPRFSVSVMGVVTGTVALCLAFVHQGGLDFKRYRPMIVIKEVVKEAPPRAALDEVKQAALEAPREKATASEAVVTRAPLTSSSDDEKPAASPRDDAPPSVTSRPSLFSGVAVAPLTLEGFPKIAFVALAKAGKELTFNQVQKTDKLDQTMVVPPGTYDLFCQVTDADHDPICIFKNLEVPPKQTVTVHINRVVAAIAVSDLSLGAKVNAIWVYPAGSKLDHFKKYNRTNHYGKPMLVVPGAEYDVSVVPEGQQEIPIAEKVRPKPGELLIVGGKAGVETQRND